MSAPHPTTAPDPAAAPAKPPGERPPSPSVTSPVPSTRVGAAWFAICTVSLLLVVLIVFMLQNTGAVEVTFLWMHGTLPLALALLIAGVGAGIATAAFGVARITQLRRLFHRR
jgi:putative membrane protein